MKPRLLLFSLVFAASAEAANLVVPAARPLVITNSEAEPVPVMVTFHGPEGRRTVETMLLEGSATIDVPAEAMLIRISSARNVVAHAANLPAVAIDALATEYVLSGDVTVANPWKVPASIVVTVRDEQRFRIVPPLDVLRINAGDASIRITSQVGVYAYDARSFVIAPVHPPATIEPPCAEPAALMTAPPGQHAAEGWIVIGDVEPSVAELTPPQLAALRCNASVQLIAQNVIAPSQP